MEIKILDIFNKFKDKTAYICYEDIITPRVSSIRSYNQINTASKKISSYFENFPKNISVALCLKHSPCLVSIICSFLQLGVTFMIIEDENIGKHEINVQFYAVITCGNHSVSQKTLTSAKVYQSKCISLDEECKIQVWTIEEMERMENMYKYKDYCYIIQTSGSLGIPKYVNVTAECIKKNIEDFVTKFQITNDDIIYFGTPLAFDPSMVELLLALTTGSCLVIICKSIRADSQKLFNVLFEQNDFLITWMQMCPSLFLRWDSQQISKIVNESSLRVLGLGGEPFPQSILPLISSKTKCKVYNFYGITEISCWASVEEISDKNYLYNEPISLGKPLNDVIFQMRNIENEILSLNDKDCQVKGILHIGSKSRICAIDNETLPYQNIVYRSTGDFVKYKGDEFYYLGRTNDIIKRFGTRFSLNYCENLISRAIGLPVTCLLYKEKLFGFIVIKNIDSQLHKKEKILDKVRVKLIEHLETINIPEYLELINSFPVKEHNGKLDKTALFQKASDILEKSNKNSVLFKFCKCLNITEQFALENNNKNFWELGGDSIRAIQLLSELHDQNRDVLNLPLSNVQEIIYDTGNCKVPNENLWKLVWKTNLFACIDSPGTIISCSDEVFIGIGNFAHIFAVFDVLTGVIKNKITLPNVIESGCLSSPNGKRIYVPCFDGNLYCLETDDLEVIWKFQTEDRVQCTPTLNSSNCIIFASYDAHIYKLSEDGLLIWKQNVKEPVKSEIKYVNNKLYFSTIKGSILCLKDTSGEVLWSYASIDPIFSPGFFSEGLIIFMDIKMNIYAFSTETDRLLWKHSEGNKQVTFSAPLVLDKFIVCASQESELYIFSYDFTKCNLVKTFSLNQGPICSAKYFSCNFMVHSILTVSTKGLISSLDICLDEKSNVSVKNFKIGFQLPAQCFSSPIIYKNRIFLGCRDNNFYCLDLGE